MVMKRQRVGRGLQGNDYGTITRRAGVQDRHGESPESSTHRIGPFMLSWGAVGAVTEVPIDATNVAATLYSKQPIDVRQGDEIELDINHQNYRVLSAVTQKNNRGRELGMIVVLEGMEQ